MHPVQATSLPEKALLARYSGDQGYTDCYCADVGRFVTHAQYVEAFYTGTVFKLERLLLGWLASRPSTDAQAKALGAGALDTFSAWRVEGRTADQLLMCDFSRHTRSWLMTMPLDHGTRLFFGSAVVPIGGKSGRQTCRSISRRKSSRRQSQGGRCPGPGHPAVPAGAG